ncbi:hypothetical protein BS50DRAFT_663785, partial [Corynespora cassiicola Philippines]
GCHSRPCSAGLLIGGALNCSSSVWRHARPVSRPTAPRLLPWNRRPLPVAMQPCGHAARTRVPCCCRCRCRCRYRRRRRRRRRSTSPIFRGAASHVSGPPSPVPRPTSHAPAPHALAGSAGPAGPAGPAASQGNAPGVELRCSLGIADPASRANHTRFGWPAHMYASGTTNTHGLAAWGIPQANGAEQASPLYPRLDPHASIWPVLVRGFVFFFCSQRARAGSLC